jgi:hypothetical protein
MAGCMEQRHTSIVTAEVHPLAKRSMFCAPSPVAPQSWRGALPGARPRAERQAGVPGRSGTPANVTGPRAADGGALLIP